MLKSWGDNGKKGSTAAAIHGVYLPAPEGEALEWPGQKELVWAEGR